MEKTELIPLYVAPSFATAIPIIEVLWRYDAAGSRHYRRKNGEVFKSLTTFISAVESTPVILQGWREKLIEELGSGDKVDTFVEATATYGTLDHEALAHIVREGQVDWLQLYEWAKRLLEGQDFSGQTSSLAATDLLNDIACFLQWIHDYNVVILAVELPVWSQHGFATLIDLVAEKDEKKYESTPPEKRKRHKCIVNLKSGRKGFFDSHGLQLIGERMMFNQVYGPAFGNIDAIYNLAPTNWRTTPDYKFYDWTFRVTEKNNRLTKLFDNYIDRAKIEDILGEPSTQFKKFEGITRVGESPVNQLFFRTYKQFVEDKSNFKQEENGL